MLTMLVRVIANNAFQDYNTMKELLTIEFSKNEMYHLRQNENVRDKLFFFVISSEEMKKIDMFSRCLRKLEIRAEYLRLSIIHDFRAESLYLVDMCSLFFFMI